MELKYIYKMAVKWLWMVILLPLIGVGVAAYMSIYNTVPLYESTASLFIFSNTYSSRVTALYGDITSAQSVIKSYGDILKSKTVLKEAIEDLKLTNITPEMIAPNVSIAFVDKTSSVLGIKVRNANPVVARNLSNKLCDIFISRVENLMGMSVVEALDRAEISKVPVNNKLKKNVGIAGFAGIVLAFVIILVVEYSNSTIIKNEEDVKKYINLPVMGIIPEIEK